MAPIGVQSPLQKTFCLKNYCSSQCIFSSACRWPLFRKNVLKGTHNTGPLRKSAAFSQPSDFYLFWQAESEGQTQVSHYKLSSPHLTTLQSPVTAPALLSAKPVNQPKHRQTSKVPHVYYAASGLQKCVSFRQKTGYFEQWKDPACSGVPSLGVLKAPISLGHYRHVRQVLIAAWTIPHPGTMEIQFMSPRHLLL